MKRPEVVVQRRMLLAATAMINPRSEGRRSWFRDR
jgi:hypothetical protein